MKPKSGPPDDQRKPAFPRASGHALEMKIALESPEQPDVIRLIDELDAYQRPLYPAASHHGIDVGTLAQSNVLFAVARTKMGRAMGCGSIVLKADHGEIKRMYVRPKYRGLGAAMALLAFLESKAIAKGHSVLYLETGVRQPEALSFYARAGYIQCGPFDGYGPDPLSVFMQRNVH